MTSQQACEIGQIKMIKPDARQLGVLYKRALKAISHGVSSKQNKSAATLGENP